MIFGIIGYGQFGRFAASHLARFGEVRAYDLSGSGTHTLEDSCTVDVLIFAVPVQSLAVAARTTKEFVAAETRIVDVSSVKQKPLEILKRFFPLNELLGTHPIFGPQSGKNGIVGLPIVLTNVSWTHGHYTAGVAFLKNGLGLSVIERTPEQHDTEMARVQGLAHFIGRALKKMNIQEYETSTKSYHHLVELRDLLKDDSWDLFQTIQNENPHAGDVRQEFLTALSELEEQLGSVEVQKDS
jgi:prephenate dehydrogenase